LYPAGETTTYRGAFLSSFLDSASSDGHETKVDYRIQPGRRPRATSVVGRVTSQPGVYEFRMALLAEVPGHGDPHQFRQSIPVEVRPVNGQANGAP
jgi:hypothetical protein